jgi:hypothetical protein
MPPNGASLTYLTSKNKCSKPVGSNATQQYYGTVETEGPIAPTTMSDNIAKNATSESTGGVQ